MKVMSHESFTLSQTYNIGIMYNNCPLTTSSAQFLYANGVVLIIAEESECHNKHFVTLTPTVHISTIQL